MPTYAVFNNILSDGIGDFSHFVDIIQALRDNPRFKGVNFLPIVLFENEGSKINKARVYKTLVDLGYENAIFGDEEAHERFSRDKTIQKQIKGLDQVIVVSNEGSLVDLYAPYLGDNIPIKLIGEHENDLLEPDNTRGALVTKASLGLSGGKKGIKLEAISHMKPASAWKVISKENPEFTKQLLSDSGKKTSSAFREDNIIVPAYFNKDNDFWIFLYRLGLGQSSFKNKNIAIYRSGCDPSSELNPFSEQAIRRIIQDTSIKEIQMIKAGEDTPTIIGGNSKGTQIARIYSGFYLSNASFDALYQLSEMAGVSGDNTFERCVSMHVLPFYWSTNAILKAGTLEALSQIIASDVSSISDDARASFCNFFNPEIYRLIQDSLERSAADDLQYQQQAAVNFSLMIDAWPNVCEHLKRHYNFYDNLEEIILANLLGKAKPVMRLESGLSEKTVFKSHDSATNLGAEEPGDLGNDLDTSKRYRF